MVDGTRSFLRLVPSVIAQQVLHQRCYTKSEMKIRSFLRLMAETVIVVIQKNKVGREFRRFCAISLFIRSMAALKKKWTRCMSVPSLRICFRAVI